MLPERFSFIEGQLFCGHTGGFGVNFHFKDSLIYVDHILLILVARISQ